MAGHDSNRTQPTLSVAMIVRDAAEHLAETLDCVRGIANEIVVLDTGSTDGTPNLARREGAAIYESAWSDSFAAARNECLRHVTGEWVLWLDAGETLDETASQKIRNFVDGDADANKAYMLFLQRPAANASPCCEQVGSLRLMANRPELRFTGRVREQLMPAVVAAGMGVDALDCVIRRSEVSLSPAARAERGQARAERNLQLVALEIAEQGESAPLLAVQAEALAQLGRTVEASALYQHILATADRGSTTMLEAYYGVLTAMDADPAAADTQIATCLAALEVFPLDAQLLCGMGSYLLRAGRLELAARSYEMAVAHGRVEPSIWHLADLADVAVVCLSLVHQLTGAAGQAERVLADALAERPQSLRLRRQMMELLIKAGREQPALAHCRLLPADAPNRQILPAIVRAAILAAGKDPAAAVGPLQEIFQAGCRDPLCLRWLAAAYLAAGCLADVETVASQWEQLDPSNLEIAAFRQAAAGRRAAAAPPASPALGINPTTLRTDGPANPLLPAQIGPVPSWPAAPAS